MDRNDFLNRYKPQVRSVVIDGQQFYMRAMTLSERTAYEEKAFTDGKVNNKTFAPELLVRTLCDKDGNRWFTDEETNQLDHLDSSILLELVDHATGVNTLAKEDAVKTAKKKG